MFKIKSVRNYYPHLTAIAILLSLLLITSFNQPADRQEGVQESLIEASSPATDMEVVDAESIRLANAVVEANERGDYQLILENDFIVVFDGKRVVGTLTYKTSLGRMVMRDNE